MNKQKVLIGICGIVFVIGIVGSAWMFLASLGMRVNIVQDGVVLYTLDINTAQNRTFEIE